MRIRSSESQATKYSLERFLLFISTTKGYPTGYKKAVLGFLGLA